MRYMAVSWLIIGIIGYTFSEMPAIKKQILKVSLNRKPPVDHKAMMKVCFAGLRNHAAERIHQSTRAGKRRLVK